ncbi:MAG: DUF547 domain-containing protein [Candidatus Sericytochromatia bacterium]|nr:DUF547 domain-containing protein [Candidatus Sericytochromatia bacterium]
MPIIILNKDKVSTQVSDKDIDQELKKAINNLKGDFFDIETGKVNYSLMNGSSTFEEYKSITARLKEFDLESLKTVEKKLSFWINIYNALVIDGIAQLGVENSVTEIHKFFESVSYNIGAYTFSLDQIEHGILRGNTKKHFFSSRPFSSSDPRLKFVLSSLDPRIHFCLVCGSTSCPPIGTYQEEKIDHQMNLAATTFINGTDVIIDQEKNTLKLSKIFKWYKKDFGSDDDLVLFLAKYRNNINDKNYLSENLGKLRFLYLDYDWNLNK